MTSDDKTMIEMLRKAAFDLAPPEFFDMLEREAEEVPLEQIGGVLGDILDDVLQRVSLVKKSVTVGFEPGLRPVLKHGSHNQKDHAGKNGGAREVEASDNDSAWDAVLTNEARALDDRMKANPERYNPRGQRDYGLKDGATETRIVRQDGPPRVRDYETNTSAGLNMTEALEVEGSLGMAVSGYGKPLVPVGDERPPQHVYRVMSTQEFDAARERGYIKSDERMNVAAGEGTVTSLRSTGSFYVPTDGSDYRVVRIKYSDEDGWRTDPIDGYIKTQDRVPFDRVDLYTTPVSQLVTKHLGGAHDQSSHGRGGGKGGYAAWGDRAKDIEAAAGRGPSRGEILAAIEGPSEDEIRQLVSEEFSSEIEDRALAMMPHYNYKERLETATDQMVNEEGPYIEESLKNDRAFMMREAMDEVYAYEHTGRNKQGVEKTFTSEVEETWIYGGDSLAVAGRIRDEDGAVVGRFERAFLTNENGRLAVSHELLELDDEAQGFGFATAFNKNAEDYYISHGITDVYVHAALSTGGYTWAKAGFDWDRSRHPQSMRNLEHRLDFFEDDRLPQLPPAQQRDWQGLRNRLTTKKVTDPDYPTPHELAMFGWAPGQKTWPGQQIMLGANWYGVKYLSPAGRRRSTTEAEAEAARLASPSRPQNQIRGQKTLDRYFREAENQVPGQTALMGLPASTVEDIIG